MAPELMSKRRRKPRKEIGNDGGDSSTTHTDRLSSLPDSLLCHILSFLDIRTSVWTMSLVSRRWRHLWKDLQVLHFEGDWGNPTEGFKKFNSFRSFALFVNNVFALRKSRHIRRLSFCWVYDEEYDGVFQEECAETWIRTATGPHLQELDLDPGSDILELPPLLLMNCTNLVSLRLTGGVEMKVQHSSLHFPSLKNLAIDNGTVDSVAAFLSNCPNLETLETFFHDTQEGPKLESTKRLKSTNDSFTCSYFNIYDFKLGIVGNFHSLMEAFVDIFSPAESEFVDPIQELCDGRFLNLLLRHSPSKWPLHAPVLIYPEFRQLDHIKFILPCFNSNLLVNMLDKCRWLQVLIIKSNKEEPSPLRTWEPQLTTVPRCLKSRLTYIHIEGYQGFEDELTFAEYILRNGLVLETMLIFVDTSMDITNKYCSVKRLTDIPRGSVKCQLKFDPTVSS